MSEESVLKQVAAAIAAKRSNLTPEEAKDLAVRASGSSRRRGAGFLRSRRPTHWEKKMAETAAATSCASRKKVAMRDIDLEELSAELEESRAPRESVRPVAPRGARHRGIRGNPAVCRDAWPHASAWRGSRHFRAALCRPSRSPARACRVQVAAGAARSPGADGRRDDRRR